MEPSPNSSPLLRPIPHMPLPISNWQLLLNGRATKTEQTRNSRHLGNYKHDLPRLTKKFPKPFVTLQVMSLLRNFLAEGYHFTLHGHSSCHLDVQDSLERFDFASRRDRQTK